MFEKLAFFLSDRYRPISEWTDPREKPRTKSSNKSDELDGTKVQFRKIRLEWERGKVTRFLEIAFSRGGPRRPKVVLKIRKIRFWAERGPAELFGARRTVMIVTETTARHSRSRECPRIRFIIGSFIRPPFPWKSLTYLCRQLSIRDTCLR